MDMFIPAFDIVVVGAVVEVTSKYTAAVDF